MTDFLSPKVLQAIEFTAHAHRNQNRKCPPDMPYFTHCAAVGVILSKAGFSDDVVIAGILHDTVEDTIVTLDDITLQFGEYVMSLVKGVTEDSSLEWAERKVTYNEHLKTVSKEIAAMSAADLLANRLGKV